MKQGLALFLQFAIATTIGCVVFLSLYPHLNPKVPLFGGLIVGFAGGWVSMYFYVLIRFGWSSAKSLKIT